MTDNIPLVVAYRLTGVAFSMSAKRLKTLLKLDNNGRPTELKAIPLYFLASHSAELFLKAALLKRGCNELDLKKYDFRHNLSSLLIELQNKGVSVTGGTVKTINGLSEQHKSNALRYTVLLDDGNETFWPPLFLVFSMLDELLGLTKISTQDV